MLTVSATRDIPNSAIPPSMSFHNHQDPGRAQLESFICTVYARRFGAELHHFAPTLVGLRDGEGLCAAAGYCDAASGALFLERYLPAPVESLLATQSGVAVARSQIVEVGHLAAMHAGHGMRLIPLLAQHLAGLGFRWVVCTLTAELRRSFVRLGIAPLALGHADRHALGEHANRWGTYYEHEPTVLAGHLPQALQRLSARDTAGAQR